MPEVREFATAQQDCQVLCAYRNMSDRLQIARISNKSFERVVFPAELLLFEASSQAELEIYADDRAQGITLLEKLTCDRLRVRG
jgi:adenylate cyclase class IV